MSGVFSTRKHIRNGSCKFHPGKFYSSPNCVSESWYLPCAYASDLLDKGMFPSLKLYRLTAGALLRSGLVESFGVGAWRGYFTTGNAFVGSLGVRFRWLVVGDSLKQFFWVDPIGGVAVCKCAWMCFDQYHTHTDGIHCKNFRQPAFRT